MKQQAPASVVSFSHLGYSGDQISEITYHSVSKLDKSDLLRTLYVLDYESNLDISSDCIDIPIPGGKIIPRILFLLEDICPIQFFDSRLIISKLFDHFVAHNIGDGQTIYLFPEFPITAEYSEKIGLSTIVYARGVHPDETLRLYNKEQERFKHDIEIPDKQLSRYQKTYDHADFVFYLCDYAKDTYISRGFQEKQLFKVGPLTVDTTTYYPGSSQTDEFVVLAVSDMSPLMGTRYLLDAWELLDLDDSKLVLCGDMSKSVSAELAPRITQMDSVEHLGHVDDIAEQYRRASVFVHPSLTEGFGKVYAEAMASELPVIATENGPVEFIDDAGLIVSIRDSQAIAENIRHLYEHPEEARRMGERGREIIKENSWEEFSERVKDAHLSVLDAIE